MLLLPPVMLLLCCADIPCFDEDNSTLVKFVDRHNGWGLTALHLAAYKGSSSTGEQHAAAQPARLAASGECAHGLPAVYLAYPEALSTCVHDRKRLGLCKSMG